MVISTSNIIFFSIILFTGALTIFTDLKSKKIYNQHLGLNAVMGIAAIIYTAFWAHENILFHFINGLIALVAGFVLHRFNLWRGGDAKLFTLYAFLMPPLGGSNPLILSPINLFSCSFIIGSIILLPLYIKDSVTNNLLHSKRFQSLINIIAITIFISWILFPIFYFVRAIHIPIISVVIIYLIYMAARFMRKKIGKNYIIIISGILFGFLMRLWLSPVSLSWPALPFFLLKIGLFSFLSAWIYGILENLKEQHDRVPFAPLLFTGCVLSYTPFLTWIMQLMCR